MQLTPNTKKGIIKVVMNDSMVKIRRENNPSRYSMPSGLFLMASESPVCCKARAGKQFYHWVPDNTLRRHSFFKRGLI